MRSWVKVLVPYIWGLSQGILEIPLDARECRRKGFFGCIAFALEALFLRQPADSEGKFVPFSPTLPDTKAYLLRFIVNNSRDHQRGESHSIMLFLLCLSKALVATFLFAQESGERRAPCEALPVSLRAQWWEISIPPVGGSGSFHFPRKFTASWRFSFRFPLISLSNYHCGGFKRVKESSWAPLFEIHDS